MWWIYPLNSVLVTIIIVTYYCVLNINTRYTAVLWIPFHGSNFDVKVLFFKKFLGHLVWCWSYFCEKIGLILVLYKTFEKSYMLLAALSMLSKSFLYCMKVSIFIKTDSPSLETDMVSPYLFDNFRYIYQDDFWDVSPYPHFLYIEYSSLLYNGLQVVTLQYYWLRSNFQLHFAIS